MLILAIETSCDDTGVALVQSDSLLKHKIIVNLVSSQFKIHKKFGGVVPKLASREHSKNLPLLLKKVCCLAKENLLDFSLKDIDIVAYTEKPGLEPCLLVGSVTAKTLAYFLDKPALPVNHIIAHIYSILLAPIVQKNTEILKFPVIALVASGGHTELYYLKNLFSIKKIGQTKDDAAGEAFDKGARLLGGPYPGGPYIEKLAKTGNKKLFTFPRPMLKSNDYNFSFAGLKTSLLYTLQKMKKNEIKKNLNNLAASYQEAIVESLVLKTLKAAEDFQAASIIIGGGVSVNARLIELFQEKIKADFPVINLFYPPPYLTGDNAAMIGVLGAINYINDHCDVYDVGHRKH